MAFSSFLYAAQAWHPLQDDTKTYVSYLVTAVLFFLLVYSGRESYPDLPRFTPPNATRFTWLTQKVDFILNSKERLAQGSKMFPDRPWKIFTDMGDILVIPLKYVEELKLSTAMDFKAAASDDLHSYVPGYEPFTAEDDFLKAIINHVAKASGSLTMPISNEASVAIHDQLKDPKEFSTISLQDVSIIVSRMASRVFMGEELCRDMAWIEASSAYVLTAFKTIYFLSFFPRSLRSVIHWFLPPIYLVRRKLKQCQTILQPHIDKRVAIKAKAAARGEPHPYNDSIEWFSRECSPSHNPAAYQITLSMLAIHTTSDLLFQTMIDIGKNPDIVAPLREELVSVLSTDGLKKSAFQKLKLMDACFKESQRIRPVVTTFFRRLALEDIRLSDGFVIKKGTKVVLDGNRLLDEEIYPDPLKWDPYRYMRMRGIPGEDSKAHLVSVTPAHFGFGYGVHACPGRFFAANTLKIAMAHLLLKYEWTIPDSQRELQGQGIGSNYRSHPDARILIRKREPELDIDLLGF
ncbi:cytochrome P450 [Colletotrichum zoysiae]|uniref:Cytochrome P450 n=1 Tax=Colletotrichum zoysiae TaxID=1216348 RepID=A0AAD9LZV3_9PEZI|nr:cytochrome P450 [Colletotrichum zoysiae]